MAYTKVTISVFVSRFQYGVQSAPGNDKGNTNMTQWLQNILSNVKRKPSDQSSIAYQPITGEEDSSSLPPTPRTEVTKATTFRAELAVFFLVICIAALAITFSHLFQDVFNRGEWWAIYLITLFSGAIVVLLFILQIQPRNSATFPFMVPGVPYIPAITIFINAVLMANLHWMTYVRFGVWMILGACSVSLSGRQSVSSSGPAGGGGVMEYQYTPLYTDNIPTLRLFIQNTKNSGGENTLYPHFGKKIPNILVKKHPGYRIPKTPGRAWLVRQSVDPSDSQLVR